MALVSRRWGDPGLPQPGALLLGCGYPDRSMGYAQRQGVASNIVSASLSADMQHAKILQATKRLVHACGQGACLTTVSASRFRTCCLPGCNGAIDVHVHMLRAEAVPPAVHSMSMRGAWMLAGQAAEELVRVHSTARTGSGHASGDAPASHSQSAGALGGPARATSMEPSSAGHIRTHRSGVAAPAVPAPCSSVSSTQSHKRSKLCYHSQLRIPGLPAPLSTPLCKRTSSATFSICRARPTWWTARVPFDTKMHAQLASLTSSTIRTPAPHAHGAAVWGQAEVQGGRHQ